MATYTTNYNLIKPADADGYDIAHQNGNMDIIDSALGGMAYKRHAYAAPASLNDYIKSLIDSGSNGGCFYVYGAQTSGCPDSTSDWYIRYTTVAGASAVLVEAHHYGNNENSYWSKTINPSTGYNVKNWKEYALNSNLEKKLNYTQVGEITSGSPLSLTFKVGSRCILHFFNYSNTDGFEEILLNVNSANTLTAVGLRTPSGVSFTTSGRTITLSSSLNTYTYIYASIFSGGLDN